MSQKATADGGNGRKTKRYDDEFTLADAIEGDRIAPELIPRSPDIDVGERVERHKARPKDPENPDDREFTVRLIAHGYRDQYQDVQSALIYDPKAELFARVTGHSSSGAWTQKERDYKVREIGREVVVKDAWDIDIPDIEDFDETPEEFVDVWVEMVFDNAAYGDDVSHELVKFDDKKFSLRDADGRSARVHYSLER